jgi:hypothetical protein
MLVRVVPRSPKPPRLDAQLPRLRGQPAHHYPHTCRAASPGRTAQAHEPFYEPGTERPHESWSAGDSPPAEDCHPPTDRQGARRQVACRRTRELTQSCHLRHRRPHLPWLVRDSVREFRGGSSSGGAWRRPSGMRRLRRLASLRERLRPSPGESLAQSLHESPPRSLYPCRSEGRFFIWPVGTHRCPGVLSPSGRLRLTVRDRAR